MDAGRTKAGYLHKRPIDASKVVLATSVDHSRTSSAPAHIRALLTTCPPNNGNYSVITQTGARTVNVKLEPKHAALAFPDSQKQINFVISRAQYLK